MKIRTLAYWLILPVFVQAECHRNWEHFEDSCYLFDDQPLSWYDAQSSCHSHNSKLAEVETWSEATFLRDKARRYGGDWWLGGRDDVVEGSWEWASNGLAFSLFDWGPGEPNNDNNQDCLKMWADADYSWDDDQCYKGYKSICEARYASSLIHR